MSGLRQSIRQIDSEDFFLKRMQEPFRDNLVDSLLENADIIAECIRNGNDVEIRHSKDGLKIYEVKKKVVR